MDTRKNYYIDNFTHEAVKAIAKQTNRSLKDVLIEAINELSDKISDSDWNENLYEIPANGCNKVGGYVRRGLSSTVGYGSGEIHVKYDEPVDCLVAKDFLRYEAETRRTYYISCEHHRMLLLIATMLDIGVSDALIGGIRTLGRKYQAQGYDVFKMPKPIQGATRFFKVSKKLVVK